MHYANKSLRYLDSSHNRRQRTQKARIFLKKGPWGGKRPETTRPDHFSWATREAGRGSSSVQRNRSALVRLGDAKRNWRPSAENRIVWAW